MMMRLPTIRINLRSTARNFTPPPPATIHPAASRAKAPTLPTNEGTPNVMTKPNRTVLVTGAAGFIGYHVVRRLAERSYDVVGLDNLNDYYDVGLKRSRLRALQKLSSFSFTRGDIADTNFVNRAFAQHRPAIVLNLAAQAGVRYSITNPHVYAQSNLVGFLNILESCRQYPVDHLLYASSSSVYGGNTKIPFEETDAVDNPVSLYAATKKSNELMATAYSHLYDIPATGLRFFTVYGPYGRPDMAYFNFTDRFFAGQPIHVFNNGDEENDLMRDFTFIDDVVESVERLLNLPPESNHPHRILNVGGSQPETLTNFIRTLEDAISEALGSSVEFQKIFEPVKAGDVTATYASAERLEALIEFKPRVTLKDGLTAFAAWYVRHYRKEGTLHA